MSRPAGSGWLTRSAVPRRQRPCCCCTSWAAVAAQFAKRFRVYALDLRGHGDSDWPGIYSFELIRDDVLGVLDQLGLDRVTLVGHSMGGTVAYLVAMAHAHGPPLL